MRPRVIVNCAMSADGKIATVERRQTAISGEQDKRRVQLLRASVDAVLVGVGTVLADDPHLTVKQEVVPNAKPPVRVVLDSRGRTPPKARVLDKSAPTIVVTNETCLREFRGVDTVRCGKDLVDLGSLMGKLSERGIKTLLVEGGGTTIWSFFEAGLVDEYKVFVGSIILGGGSAPTPVDGTGFARAEQAVRLRLERSAPADGGVLLEYAVVR